MRTERFYKDDIIDVGGVRLGITKTTPLAIPDSHTIRRVGKLCLIVPLDPNPSVDNCPVTAETK